MSTLETIQCPRRPVRPLTLPGGSEVFIRDLSLRELDELERLAGTAPEGERNIRYALLQAAAVLCEPDGRPCFLDVNAGSVHMEDLTPEQINAINRAATPTKDDAKNA